MLTKKVGDECMRFYCRIQKASAFENDLSLGTVVVDTEETTAQPYDGKTRHTVLYIIYLYVY